MRINVSKNHCCLNTMDIMPPYLHLAQHIVVFICLFEEKKHNFLNGLRIVYFHSGLVNTHWSQCARFLCMTYLSAMKK